MSHGPTQTWGYHPMIENDWNSLERGLIEAARHLSLGVKDGAPEKTHVSSHL